MRVQIEFAVNDDQDAMHAHRECVRGMEGIIRHAREAQPHMDIVVVYFARNTSNPAQKAPPTTATTSCFAEESSLRECF